MKRSLGERCLDGRLTAKAWYRYLSVGARPSKSLFCNLGDTVPPKDAVLKYPRYPNQPLRVPHSVANTRRCFDSCSHRLRKLIESFRPATTTYVFPGVTIPSLPLCCGIFQWAPPTQTGGLPPSPNSGTTVYPEGKQEEYRHVNGGRRSK